MRLGTLFLSMMVNLLAVPGRQVDDVSSFLEKLNLEEYIPTFLREEINLDLVGKLTEESLRQMRVRSIGKRLRVLRAAKELETFNQAKTEPPEINVPETPETIEYVDFWEINFTYN